MAKQPSDTATNVIIFVFPVAGLVATFYLIGWINLTWALLGKLVLLNLAAALAWNSFKELVKK